MSHLFKEEIELKSLLKTVKEKKFSLIFIILISFIISAFVASKISKFETFVKLNKPSFVKFLELNSLSLTKIGENDQENEIKLAMQMQNSFFKHFEKSISTNTSLYNFLNENYQSLFSSDKYLKNIKDLNKSTNDKKIYFMYNEVDSKLFLIYPDKFPGTEILQKFILLKSEKYEKEFIQNFKKVLEIKKDTIILKNLNESTNHLKNDNDIRIIENNLKIIDDFNLDWDVMTEKPIHYRSYNLNKFITIFYGTIFGFTIGFAVILIVWLYRLQLGKIR